jgi:hypothetical protein
MSASITAIQNAISIVNAELETFPSWELDSLKDRLINLLELAMLDSYELAQIVLIENEVSCAYTINSGNADKVLAHILERITHHNADIFTAIVWVSPTEWKRIEQCAYPNDTEYRWHTYKVPAKPIGY